ncbi:MAG: hypothetical protein ABIH91_04235, partial [Candidatus Omnitrophota bacterium]
AELYADNTLEQLNEFELGVVAASVVFEPRKNQRMPTGISKSTGHLKKTCESTYDRVKNKERRYKIYPFSKLPYFHLCSSMEAWLRGTNFDKTMQFTDCDEGEVVRYFRMSVQVLREISQAPVASYLLKDKIKETIRVINRDIINAEKQLREG